MNEALQTGLYLTVAGMGLVFFVLAMLWGLITLLLKFDEEPKPEISTVGGVTALPEADGALNLEVVAVISAAVQAYKTERSLRGASNAPAYSKEENVDYWSMAGRAQQHSDWHPRRGN